MKKPDHYIDVAEERIEKASHQNELGLNLSDLPLRRLPESITKVLQLERLYLNCGELTCLPDNIGALKNLKILDLGKNQLESLPESFGQLRELKRLNISENNLVSLPISIKSLNLLEILCLHGNEGLRLPIELLGSKDSLLCGQPGNTNPADILDYYFRTR